MQLQSKQDLHTNQKLVLNIFKNKKLPNKQNPTTGHSQTSKQLPTPKSSLLLDQQDHPTRLMVTQ